MEFHSVQHSIDRCTIVSTVFTQPYNLPIITINTIILLITFYYCQVYMVLSPVACNNSGLFICSPIITNGKLAFKY